MWWFHCGADPIRSAWAEISDRGGGRGVSVGVGVALRVFAGCVGWEDSTAEAGGVINKQVFGWL